MPPTKTAKKTTKATRKLSASHKKALAEGRTMSATVDRYIAAISVPKARGRKVTKATLVARLAKAQDDKKTATGVSRVLAAQTSRDLQTRLAHMSSANGNDVKVLEAAFIKIAKKFGDARGVGYGAWRDAGVPPAVLKKAGVARTRG